MGETATSPDLAGIDLIPTTCRLHHPMFALLGDISFRSMPSDQTAVMVVPLGERSASIALASVRRSFAIEDQTPDGRMLDLIAEGVEYVEALRPGDPLPREILDGGASWQPASIHREFAHARLRSGLIAWFEEGSIARERNDATAIQAMRDEPRLRQRMAAAAGEAALSLGLAYPEEVVALVDDFADELSYIEALRDRLLRNADRMTRKIAYLAQGFRGDVARSETLIQVQRLAEIAVRQIASRFEEIDGQCGEVLVALRDAPSHRAFIRSNRNWLYRTLRAWEPTLNEWAVAPRVLGEAAWLIIGRTYQFLATRHLMGQQWESAVPRRRNRKRETARGMQW